MIKTHATREVARRTLVEEGYTVGFSSPGRPELWVKGKSRLATARRVRGADEDWIILPYPEPSSATPEQVAELAKRDGVVLSGGVMPQPEEVTINTPEGVDPDSDLL